MKYNEIKSLSYIGMGGIFLRNLPMLIISIISGYLYVSWLPTPNTFSFYNLVLEFVLNPIKVFAATITFFIGFITSGIFIRHIILQLKNIRRQKGSILFESIIYILLLIITCYFLMRLGFWQMSLFFSFAIVYGMMTIEKNK